MIAAPGDTYIRTVRARTAERDTLAVQIRLGRALAALSLHPSSVPASAVVCVRRLSAPAPGLPPAGRAASRRAGDYDAAWGREVESSLARLVEGAARPARGPVPADAEAVLFADRAEMLACLAADWLGGLAARRWWWRAVLKGEDAGSALLSEWLGAPAHVPAALEHLARAGAAAEFIAALRADDARALSRRVAEVFALEELRAALAAAPARDRPADDDAGARAGPPPGAAAPWRAFVPESRALLFEPEQECLLGVALALARSNVYARSPSFARGVRAWRAGVAVIEPGACEEAEGTAPAPESDGRDVRAAARGSSTARAAGASPAGPGRPEGVGAPAGARAVRQETRETPDEESGSAPSPDSEPPKRVAVDRAPPSGHAPRERVLRPARRGADVGPAPAAAGPSPRAEPSPPAPYLLEACIDTKLGGLFYLINLGLYLELYGDFTSPRRPGLALSVWDFVTLVGRRLCGERREEDPVWPLLARLAGRRAEEPPGHDFEPPADWRVPPSWLAPFPAAGVWSWSAGGGRLRVRHHEGFTLVDVALGRGDASRRLREETAAYAARASFELRRDVTCEPFEGGGGPLEWWVGRVAAYASARLRRALGAGGPRELARVLVAREARVSVTATHVDVLFRLAELPVEVRLSGLDRDPGWVPAAGRFVAFRYE